MKQLMRYDWETRMLIPAEEWERKYKPQDRGRVGVVHFVVVLMLWMALVWMALG